MADESGRIQGVIDVSDTEVLEAERFQHLLTTACFGRYLHVHAETASTNDDVKRLAMQGAPEGTVVVADHQTQGRGRQGRRFASPAGVGIYLSILLRPSVPSVQLPPLTLLAAVAAADALVQVTGLAIALKWPNDVEIDGKKVAGILTEAMIRPGATPDVVIGIGINVNTRLEHLPPELHSKVTSLALCAGRPFSRYPLMAAFLLHLENLYQRFQRDGLGPIRDLWLQHGRLIGRRIRFSQAAAPMPGTVLQLQDDGALLVQPDTGGTQRVISGDITFL